MADDETPEIPKKFSMLAAGRAIGKSKASMHRYIESGRISASKVDGGYEIDPAELFRVFPEAFNKFRETGSGNPEGDDAEPHETDGTVPQTANENSALRAQIKMLRELVERADLDLDRERRAASDAIADYRRRLDLADSERRALNQQLLTYQQPPVPVSEPVPVRRGGFLGLFRKAG